MIEAVVVRIGAKSRKILRQHLDLGWQGTLFKRSEPGEVHREVLGEGGTTSISKNVDGAVMVDCLSNGAAESADCCKVYPIEQSLDGL